MTCPAEIRDGLSHDALRLACGIALGVVEEVDPCLTSRRQALGGEAGVELRTEAHPRAEAQLADPETAPTKVPILHAHSF